MQHPTSQHLQLVLDHNDFKWYFNLQYVQQRWQYHIQRLNTIMIFLIFLRGINSSLYILLRQYSIFQLPSSNVLLLFKAEFYSHLVSLYERGFERANLVNFYWMNSTCIFSKICTVQLQSIIGLLFRNAPQRLEKTDALKANCNVKIYHV